MLKGRTPDLGQACASHLSVLERVKLSPLSRERRIMQQALRM